MKMPLTLLVLLLFTQFIVGQTNTFPYSINKKDYAYLGVGVSTIMLSQYFENKQHKMSHEALIALDNQQINAFDRSAIHQWNNNLNTISDVSQWALYLTPGIILMPQLVNKNWNNALCYSTMYIELTLLSLGITNLTKTTTQRIRPYLYNTNDSMDEKLQLIETENVYDSFFSGHSAISFASAVFLSTTFTEIYGNNTWSKVIWGSSITLAATNSFLRYRSGQHFPTDIIAGAIIGSTIGYLIPLIHKNKPQGLSYIISYQSMQLAYRF